MCVQTAYLMMPLPMAAGPMDEHTPGGIMDFDKLPARMLNFEGVYTIPYRCFYSRNVDNLMMAGRDISASKMAFGSTRVMGTCAVGGQAAGTAAAMAVEYSCGLRDVGKDHIEELQQLLLKDDCYIPGYRNTDPGDLARQARVSASSALPESPGGQCNKRNFPRHARGLELLGIGRTGKRWGKHYTGFARGQSLCVKSASPLTPT